jgi:hypothetical protein
MIAIINMCLPQLLLKVMHLMASMLSKQAEIRPCTDRPNLSRACGGALAGSSSNDFNAGSVGPTRSISEDSSFRSSRRDQMMVI